MENWMRLRKIIIANAPLGESDIKVELETDLFLDLEYDSVALMQLFFEIEEEFGVDYIELENFERRMEQCGEILKGIEELMGKRGEES